MSSSGLIYAAIAIMWAAVLIPMWLRNHDSATENRSVERFGQAMRVLRRDQPRPSADRDLPVRETARAETARVEAPRPPRTAPAPRRRAPQPSLAQRRARTLGVLALLTGLLVLTAAVTPVPWWAPLPVFALLVAFVVHLRVQARQRVQRHRVQRGRAARPLDESVTQPAPDAPQVAASGFVPGPSRAVVVETKGSRSTQSADAAATAESTAPATQDADDAEWRPNPLPLPTYVTAPKAVRPIKVIDLTTPGAWSSGRLIEDDLAEEDLLAAEVADAELDALLEQEAKATPDAESTDRRAVGD